MNSLNLYYTFDRPIQYKGLVFHPVKLKDYYLFLTLVSCLFLEKNSIRDPQLAIKAISMTYLEFLVASSDEDNKYLYLLDGLFRVVLNEAENKDFSLLFVKKEGNRLGFAINGKEFDGSDFEQMRDIIAEQNGLDLPNEKIQKDVRDRLEEARRFKQKVSTEKITDLEGQIIALSLFTGWSLEYIHELPMRKFFMMVRRANHMVMSDIYLTASMSGFVTFKDKRVLKSWLADIEMEDKYGDVKVSPEAIQDKISFDSAKNK